MGIYYQTLLFTPETNRYVVIAKTDQIIDENDHARKAVLKEELLKYYSEILHGYEITENTEIIESRIATHDHYSTCYQTYRYPVISQTACKTQNKTEVSQSLQEVLNQPQALQTDQTVFDQQ